MIRIETPGLSSATADATYLKLDQTTPQATVGTFTFPQIKDSGLTVTRIPYVSTDGLLVDSANLVYDPAGIGSLGIIEASFSLTGADPDYGVYIQNGLGQTISLSTSALSTFTKSGTEYLKLMDTVFPLNIYKNGGPCAQFDDGTGSHVLKICSDTLDSYVARAEYGADYVELLDGTYGVITNKPISALSFIATGLTSGRVVLAGTGGLLGDDAGLTFNPTSDTLQIGTGASYTQIYPYAGNFVQTNLYFSNNFGFIGKRTDGVNADFFYLSGANNVIYGDGNASKIGWNGHIFYTNYAHQMLSLTEVGGGTIQFGGGKAGIDYILKIDGETNDGIITWMEDEDYFKFADDLFLDKKIVGYNAVATEGYGVPAIVDDVALTAQSASIGSTNFTNAGTAGNYRLNYYLEATTLNVGATSIQLTVAWTDDAGATTVTSSALPLTALGRTSGVFYIQLASGSVSYSTTLIDATGLARYALYMDLERMK